MQEITFRNEREDLDAYYDYILTTEAGKQLGKQAFVTRIWYLCLVLAMIFLFVWGAFGYLGISIGWSILVTIGCSTPLVLGFIIALAKMRFRPFQSFGKQLLKNSEKTVTERDFQIFQLPRTIKIEEEWLQVSNSEALHQWRWGIVDSVILTSEFIYVSVGKCWSLHIPKRDFLSPEDFQSFGKKLSEMANKHKNQPLSSKAVGQR